MRAGAALTWVYSSGKFHTYNQCSDFKCSCVLLCYSAPLHLNKLYFNFIKFSNIIFTKSHSASSSQSLLIVSLLFNPSRLPQFKLYLCVSLLFLFCSYPLSSSWGLIVSAGVGGIGFVSRFQRTCLPSASALCSAELQVHWSKETSSSLSAESAACVCLCTTV